MDVSIVIPIYKPDKDLLKKVLEGVKEQDYNGKIEIIKVDKGWGLADQLNWGIKKAKNEIVVTLHQDCIPASKTWLKKLVVPLKNKEFVASSSKVELPYHFWKKFDRVSRVLSAKEQKVIFTVLDEKGSAYKKSALIKVGLFDSKNFRTAGEDDDMGLKLEKIGKIATPNPKIIHLHHFDRWGRIKKELQCANGLGALIRIYKFKIQIQYVIVGFIKAIPFLGWPIFLFRFPYSKMKLSSILWIPLSLVLNFIYGIGFWKGFLEGKQTI